MDYDEVEVPDGEIIRVRNAKTDELAVPDNPIIPIIYGDGIGQDIAPAAQKVLSSAADVTGREIKWMRLYAGGNARDISIDHQNAYCRRDSSPFVRSVRVVSGDAR